MSDLQTAARAVLSLGIDVARWHTNQTRQTPTAFGQEYGELVLRMLGARTC